MTTSSATPSRELSNMSSAGVSSVENSTSAIRGLLAKAHDVKPDGGVEPALTAQDLGGGIEELGKQNGAFKKGYAAIETACRNIFYALLVRLSGSKIPNSVANNPRHRLRLRSLCLVRCGTFLTSFRSSPTWVSLMEMIVAETMADSPQRFANPACFFGSLKSCLTRRP